jgi:hypothetical protein
VEVAAKVSPDNVPEEAEERLRDGGDGRHALLAKGTADGGCGWRGQERRCENRRFEERIRNAPEVP